MAETDPLLDPLLDEDDENLISDVGIGMPQSGAGPVPEDLDTIAPDTAVAPPDQSGTLSLSSDSVNPTKTPASGVDTDALADPAAADLDKIAALATPPATPAPAPGSAEDIEKRQGVVDAARASINETTAQQIGAAAKEADEDARLERADYMERRQAAEADLDQRVKAFETTKLEPHRNTFRSKLSVIFGGLGAAYRSAGGGDAKNYALQSLQQKWHDETELQKANIAALREGAVMARTRLNDVNEGRRQMMRDADARLLSKYNLAIRQGEAQLKAQGKTQAEIDADKRILSLRQGAAVRAAAARKADDDHALNMARIESEKARAERLRAQAGRDRARTKGKGTGGGGGGGGGRDGEAQVADYLIANPGDIGGATRLAGKLGVDGKRFDKIVMQTKGTEGQNKNAHQAKIGLDAIDAIEASGYKPSKDDIQKWLNNSRMVHLADKEGVIGGAAALGQNNLPLVGRLVPQSEVEGLSPEAAAYFGNVRRYMETIGRAQSGAAISPSEWTNFFNQYGPNSKGGMQAARQYLQDQFKISGVAGRSLGAGGAPAAKRAGPTAQEDSEAVAWAKKNLSNPKARAILKANGL